jgi:hypothetical protein
MPDPLAQDDVLSFDPRSPFLTAPDAGDPAPVVASRAAADLQPRIEEAGRHSQAAVEAAERSMAQEDRNAATRERELAPLRERQMEMARQPLPEPPKTKESPPAPQRQNQHDDENWLFAAGLLGSLAGALTRNHATNALAAFSGALQGYQEGSKQKFDENMQIWNAENKRAQEASQNALAEYRSILENRKLSMEQMSVELQLAAAKHDDRAMATAAKTKNELVIAQLYDKHEQALTQVQTTHDRLSQSYELAQQRQQQQMVIAQMRALGVVPGQESATVDKIGKYELPPVTGPRGTAIMNLVAERYPDYDIKKWFDEKARSTIPASVERAGLTTEERIGASRGAQLELIARTGRELIPRAAASADAIPASSFPRINELLSMTDQEIGNNPALTRLKMDTLALEENWARAMNPTGTMTVNNVNRAHSVIAQAYTRETYRAALEELNGLLETEIKAIKGFRAHEPLEPLNLPPLKPSGSMGEAVSPIANRAGGSATTFGLPKTPKYGVGSMVPKPKPGPSSPADMPMMLPPGWKHEVEP